MAKDRTAPDEDFFLIVLKEEARSVLWQVGADADPHALVESVLHDLQDIATADRAGETRSEEEIRHQVRERLLKAAYATRPHCIRCGTCCIKGSPTLLREDMILFRDDILRPEHVFTLRKGETAHSGRTGETGPSLEERIKIRETPGDGTCIFYDSPEKSCAIYDSRPVQCRRQECWNPESYVEAEEVPLEREDLLRVVGQLWDVILRHEERCSHDEFGRAVSLLAATEGASVDEVIDILSYDHHARTFLAKHLNMPAESMDFFLGRPLSESLEQYGLRLEERPAGSFFLTVAAGDDPDGVTREPR
jgi:Fe-S-cluster containining protein